MTAVSQLLEQGLQLESSLKNGLTEARGCEAIYSTSDYLRSCHHDDTRLYSNEIPEAQMVLFRKISEEHGPAIALLYNQLALAQLSMQRLRSEVFGTLPEPIQQLTRNWIGRVYADLAIRDPQSYDLQQIRSPSLDDLKRDFAVCTGRATPVGGAWVAERRKLVEDRLFDHSGRVGRNNASAGGRAMYRALKRMASVAGILEPITRLRNNWYQLRGRYTDYLVIHTANRYRRYFSEKYLNEAYHNIALLLQQDTSLQGLYRSSWFLDPKVIEIDPKLAFLSRIPIQNGALYGPLKRLEGTELDNALKHSKSRKSAYDQGDYEPWSWAYLWLSTDLLDWAQHGAAVN